MAFAPRARAINVRKSSREPNRTFAPRAPGCNTFSGIYSCPKIHLSPRSPASPQLTQQPRQVVLDAQHLRQVRAPARTQKPPRVKCEDVRFPHVFDGQVKDGQRQQTIWTD